MTNGERKRQQTKTINDKAKQKAATTTTTTTKEGKTAKQQQTNQVPWQQILQ